LDSLTCELYADDLVVIPETEDDLKGLMSPQI